MKALILLALVASAAAFDFQEEWEAWKAEHNKEYKDEQEELRRHMIWQSNKEYVEEHNANADKFGFTLGLNQFGDLENHEFVAMMNGYKMDESSNNTNMFEPDPNFKLPDTVDWRDKGAVTEVKNQGQCGSCWAFSTTGSVEGQHFLKGSDHKLVSLSEQNLIDCSKKYGNEGCQGGLMTDAFEYIEHNKGIDTEASYPYKAHNEKCKFSAANVGATVKGFKKVLWQDEHALQRAVAEVGPISVAIDASRGSFQHYKSGVYYEERCSRTHLDHGVLAVGYGTDGDKEYWLVKNSWGKKWGMDGYIKMSRNRHNNCGIATQASYPTV